MTPSSITLVRVVAIVQTVLGGLTCVTLGFLALLGLAWTTDDGSGPDALAVAYTAIFVVALGVTIAIACLAGALRAGAVRARVALLVLELVAVGGTVTLLAIARSGGSLEGLFVAPVVYACCGFATIVALLQPSARTWCRAVVPR